MSSIQDQDVIQALFPDYSNPPFCMRICVGCPKRGVHDMVTFRRKDSAKGLGELSVIVMDQEAKGGFRIIEFPNQLPGLLSDPHFVGMGSDTSQMLLDVFPVR